MGPKKISLIKSPTITIFVRPKSEEETAAMKISETTVSEAIIKTYTERFLSALKTRVAIVGGGPAGLMASYVLAKNGIKAVLFERKLSMGGGMWGGGIGFNVIVVQEEAGQLLETLGVRAKAYRKGYFTAHLTVSG